MARCSKSRNFLKEVAKSPFVEKLSFLLPFFVITIDVIILEHAIRIQETYIIVCTSFLFILSLIEIVAVSSELHQNYRKSNFEKTLAVKLDDFITENREFNIKRIVANFITYNPEYNVHRNDVYHLTCQILEKRGEDTLEKIIDENLKE